MIALDIGRKLPDMTHTAWVVQVHILNINYVRNKCPKPKELFKNNKT